MLLPSPPIPSSCFDNDITTLPPSQILSHHSHNIYHTPASGHAGPSYTSAYTPRRSPAISTSSLIPGLDAARDYSLRSPILLKPFEYEQRAAALNQLRALTPPATQRSPASELPDEIWLQIFGHLEQEEVLAVRPVCQAFATLALSPCLHRSLILHSLPSLPLPPMLVDHILPSLHHLHLHLFPFPATLLRDPHPATILLALLDAIPADQLISLSLPFSSPYLPATELGQVIRRIGGKLEKLDLRGSGLTGSDYLDWIGGVGKNGKGLKELDLAFTSISALPNASMVEQVECPDAGNEAGEDVWPQLKRLSLASCTSLSAPVLASFLSALPPSIETLDISRLEQVTLPALQELRVTHQSTADAEEQCSQLRDLKLVGIDHLTRANIRALKKHWEEQRLALLPLSMVPAAIAIPAPRVWGEPGASPRSASFFATTPNSAYYARDRRPDSPMAIDASPPSTPSLTSRCSSASSNSSQSSAFTSAFGTSPASSLEERMAMPRASALSSHAALWSALAEDRAEGMFASQDVYSSKLPSHTNLPSRLSRDVPPTNGSERCRRESILKGPTGFRSRLRSIDFDSPWPTKRAGATGVAINVTHSAILESEDEEGYRMFIGEVAGSVQMPTAMPMPTEQFGGATRLHGGASAGLGLGAALEMQGAWTYRAQRPSAGLGLGM